MWVWHETADDFIEVAGSRVRRRSWKAQTGPRHWFELTVHVGRDGAGFATARWECEIWNEGLPADRMWSPPKHVRGCWYAPEDHHLDQVVERLTPSVVSDYAVWGKLFTTRDGS